MFEKFPGGFLNKEKGQTQRKRTRKIIYAIYIYMYMYRVQYMYSKISTMLVRPLTIFLMFDTKKKE